MRNLALVIAAVIVITVPLVSVYLSPDDLRGCAAEGPDESNCQKADVIVAVSGGNTSIRTDEAIRLYKEGWADTLMFSGAARDTSGPSNAEAMKAQAIRAGVPAASIITESLARTTKQNAEQTKALLATAGGGTRRVILVTSGYHQRRAGLEFRERAGDSIIIINHPTPSDPDWPTLWWLTPRGWWLAGGEISKITAFYLGQSQ